MKIAPDRIPEILWCEGTLGLQQFVGKINLVCLFRSIAAFSWVARPGALAKGVVCTSLKKVESREQSGLRLGGTPLERKRRAWPQGAKGVAGGARNAGVARRSHATSNEAMPQVGKPCHKQLQSMTG